MKARLTIPSLVAALLLTACATPRTAQGYIDTDGDGIGESVTVIEAPQDTASLQLHMQKIDARRKILETAQLATMQLKELYKAGRSNVTEIAASEAITIRANIDLIDAQVELANSGLLAVTEPTMIDTDDDSLPDMLVRPLQAKDLLQQKVDLCLKLFETSKLRAANAEDLYKAGRTPDTEIAAIKNTMYRAKLSWIDARLELANAK